MESYREMAKAGFSGWWSSDSYSTEYMKTFQDIIGVCNGPRMILPEEVEYIYLSCLNRQTTDIWRTNDGHRLKEWLRICKSAGGKIAII